MRVRSQTLSYLIPATLAISLLADGTAAAQSYTVKPSEVVIPPQSTLGNYQRVIRPFENWTLICDEDLVSMQRICNVSQSIVDESGDMIFSWSLSATKDGDPTMIMRLRHDTVADEPVTFNVAEARAPVDVKITGCDQMLCMAFLPVGRVMREQIKKESVVKISYSSASKGRVQLNAPLAGLADALAAID
ncbi:invasion associated locus B family protein [Ochrobactrum sp. AN78]|uniref:invasion associated locus B family protein n=1 Tax=Ochrobactrum sp. AN78 TaxID=3039853 RepID=UPI00298A00CF|nr:invasion associated locus B family protein [Ochrobactrum sp. AN78]MDH7791604.1 invasion protein IalB [Ochrobactrum sp. AN78]